MNSEDIKQFQKDFGVSPLLKEEREDVAQIKKFFDLYNAPMETMHSHPNLVDYAREYSLSLDQVLHLSFELSYYRTPEDRNFSDKIFSRGHKKRTSAYTLQELCVPYLIKSMEEDELSAFKNFVNGNLLGIFEAMFETPELMIGNKIVELQNEIARNHKSKKEVKAMERDIDAISQQLASFHQTFSKFVDPDLFIRILNRRYVFKRADNKGFVEKTLIEHADHRSDGAFLAFISHIAIILNRSSDLFNAIDKIPNLAAKVYHTPNESYFSIYDDLSFSQKKRFLTLSYDRDINKGKTLFERLAQNDSDLNPLIWLYDFIGSEKEADQAFAMRHLNFKDQDGVPLKSKVLPHKDNVQFFYPFLLFLQAHDEFIPTFDLLLSDINATETVRQILETELDYPAEAFKLPSFTDYVMRDASFVRALEPSRLKSIAPFLSKKVFDASPTLFKEMLEIDAPLTNLSKDDLEDLVFAGNPSLFSDFISNDAADRPVYKILHDVFGDKFAAQFDKELLFDSITRDRHAAVQFLFNHVPFETIADAFMEKNPLLLTNTMAHADMFKQIKNYLIEKDPDILSALEEELPSLRIKAKSVAPKKKSVPVQTLQGSTVKASPSQSSEIICDVTPFFADLYKEYGYDADALYVIQSRMQDLVDGKRPGKQLDWALSELFRDRLPLSTGRCRIVFDKQKNEDGSFHLIFAGMGNREDIYKWENKILDSLHSPLKQIVFKRISDHEKESRKKGFKPQQKRASDILIRSSISIA